ncbi:MAG: aminodeoxychorismate/anthranilate synthase component II [Pirellulales bacterium]
MILLVDNYDSFVFNLARYFQRLGCETHVVRNDEIDPAYVKRLAPSAVVLSPGPRTPAQAGACVDIVRELAPVIPMLGVCLGHQCIAAAYGGRIVPAVQPMHGRTSEIRHDGQGVFAGLPDPLTVCRYHSLVAEQQSLPECLRVTAHSADGTIMALAHRTHAVVGVQFHPESILTDSGYPLVANFLRMARCTAAAGAPVVEGELCQPTAVVPALPRTPLTF